MWSCKFDGRPIELSILLINPSPGKPFNLGGIKVWNWNNKISVSWKNLIGVDNVICLPLLDTGVPSKAQVIKTN